ASPIPMTPTMTPTVVQQSAATTTPAPTATSTLPPSTQTPTPVLTPTPIPPTATTAPPPTSTSVAGFDPFGEDRNCGDFATWSAANAFFIAAGGPANDPHQLDGDNDGTPCESLPGAP
ncbi:MAG: excalibur calcium-binding domain-containing protein, partial [Dehalococcoidia bacterium]